MFVFFFFLIISIQSCNIALVSFPMIDVFVRTSADTQTYKNSNCKRKNKRIVFKHSCPTLKVIQVRPGVIHDFFSFIFHLIEKYRVRGTTTQSVSGRRWLTSQFLSERNPEGMPFWMTNINNMEKRKEMKNVLLNLNNSVQKW